MQLSRRCILSHAPCLCTALTGGTDGRSCLSWRTAFRHDFEESVNSHQSPRLCPWPGFVTGGPQVDHILLSGTQSLFSQALHGSFSFVLTASSIEFSRWLIKGFYNVYYCVYIPTSHITSSCVWEIRKWRTFCGAGVGVGWGVGIRAPNEEVW
jgi:hypothetical protein